MFNTEHVHVLVDAVVVLKLQSMLLPHFVHQELFPLLLDCVHVNVGIHHKLGDEQI